MAFDAVSHAALLRDILGLDDEIGRAKRSLLLLREIIRQRQKKYGFDDGIVQGMGRRNQTVVSMDIIYYTTGRSLLGHCIFKPDGGTIRPIANSYSTYGCHRFCIRIIYGIFDAKRLGRPRMRREVSAGMNVVSADIGSDSGLA